MSASPASVLAGYAQDTGAFRVSNKGASELADACAAVAELIGAVALVVEFIDGAHGEPGEIGCKAEDDLRAALARVGGAK